MHTLLFAKLNNAFHLLISNQITTCHTLETSLQVQSCLKVVDNSVRRNAIKFALFSIFHLERKPYPCMIIQIFNPLPMWITRICNSLQRLPATSWFIGSNLEISVELITKSKATWLRWQKISDSFPDKSHFVPSSRACWKWLLSYRTRVLLCRHRRRHRHGSCKGTTAESHG